MIIYTGTKKEFQNDIESGNISEKIIFEMNNLNFNHNNPSEVRSWQNSLIYMDKVLSSEYFPDDIRIAIEYQLPLTSKRVDFLITGKGLNNENNVMIIELKQWEKAKNTKLDNTVNTYVGGALRDVVHPSYQAFSYAKTIENFNESIHLNDINLIPCAYLHNYDQKYKFEIDNDFFSKITAEAPLFLKNDIVRLREFIKKYINKSDDGSLLYKIEHGKIKPSKFLQDSLVSMLKGNKEFYMIDEQQVAFATVKNIIDKSIYNNNKTTVIIEGGPGTGKSVIAVNLLANITGQGYNARYVTKNQAPRDVYYNKLIKGDFKKSYIKNLFQSSGVFTDTKNNEFDCLLSDESHRLNEKSGLFRNKGENQIKEIIKSSKVSVFFIDEKQKVTVNDIGEIHEIRKWANKLGSRVIHNENTKLISQFRCSGSDGYIKFIDALLVNLDRHEYSLDGYDFKVFDNPNLMREAIREKNKENNKSRMLAGYCYNWESKKRPFDEIYDIYLEDGFKAKWNFHIASKIWATDNDSFDQVGCIHTSQGLEFDYIGVIIGEDLRYENGQVKTDYTKRAKTDRSLHGLKKKGEHLADPIIINTYRTLLTRGQKGCYVYCEDKNLSKYIKHKLQNLK